MVTGSVEGRADRRGPLAGGGRHRRPRRPTPRSAGRRPAPSTPCSRHRRPMALGVVGRASRPRRSSRAGARSPRSASATARPIRLDPRSMPRTRLTTGREPVVDRDGGRASARRRASGASRWQPAGRAAASAGWYRLPRTPAVPTGVPVGGRVGRVRRRRRRASAAGVVSTGSGTTSVTRRSNVGIVVTKPGHRSMSTSPYGLQHGSRLGLGEAQHLRQERRRVDRLDLLRGTRDLERHDAAATVPSPTSTRRRVRHELAAGVDRASTSASSAIASTGVESTARDRPLGRQAERERLDLLPDQRLGVGRRRRLAEHGGLREHRRAGRDVARGSRAPPGTASASCALERAPARRRRPSATRAGTPRACRRWSRSGLVTVTRFRL